MRAGIAGTIDPQIDQFARCRSKIERAGSNVSAVRSRPLSSHARRQLGVIALIQVLTMSLWFSASAVAPALRSAWGLSEVQSGFLTTSVQLGFVCGAILSAILNLADIVPPRLLIAACALGAAASNALVTGVEGWHTAMPLRFLTGIFLAGVYPVGLKVMTTWYREGRSRALGIMVGALTLGSATPHFIGSWSELDWQTTLLVSSVLGTIGGLGAVCWIRTGPHAGPKTPFSPRYVVKLVAVRRLRLINLGYLGHMWELYALWAWLPLFLGLSLERQGAGPDLQGATGIITFSAIGICGLLGCVAGGVLATRWGAFRVAKGALAISGVCCLLSPLAFTLPAPILIVVLLIWGAAVIADSAQFSTALSEAVETQYIGTALTAQTAAGFALTAVSIYGVPVAAATFGWQWALLGLGLGPLFGYYCMAQSQKPAPRAR